MKKSNKILLAGVIFVFVLVLILAVLSRFFIKINTDKGLSEKGSQVGVIGESTIRDFKIRDFREIELSGSWKVNINQSDIYQIRIKAPSDVMDKVLIKKNGRTLKIGSNKGIGRKVKDLEAEITLPYLSRLDVSGSNKIFFTGFKIDTLEMKILGANQIKGRGNSIRNLSLDCSGASEIQLKESSVVNLNFDLSGSNKIELTMLGGDMSGSASGSSSVIYSGQAAQGSITLSGLASIIRE